MTRSTKSLLGLFAGLALGAAQLPVFAAGDPDPGALTNSGFFENGWPWGYDSIQPIGDGRYIARRGKVVYCLNRDKQEIPCFADPATKGR